MFSGSLFQSHGAAENEQWPTVTSREGWTTRSREVNNVKSTSQWQISDAVSRYRVFDVGLIFHRRQTELIAVVDCEA